MSPTLPETTDFRQRILSYLRSGFPALYVTTWEEGRAERSICSAAGDEKMRKQHPPHGRAVWIWSSTRGWVEQLPDGRAGRVDAIRDPVAAVDKILTYPEEAVFILRDFHHYLEFPDIIRRLRDLFPVAKSTGRTVIFESPRLLLPVELEKDVVLCEFSLPKVDELGVVLDGIIESVGVTAAAVRDRRALLDALRGLTVSEAENTLSLALVQHGAFDDDAIVSVQREKAGLLKKTGTLEYFEPRETLDSVGGLNALKHWLTVRERAFSPKAAEFGLLPPRGLLLVGVQGCLAEGTRLTYKRGNRKSAGGRALSIEALYEKFNDIQGHGRAHAAPRWASDLATMLQSWDVETGRLVYNEIESIADSGEKDCRRIITDTAGVVELTDEHPVLLGDGTWRDAGAISVGDTLLVRGSMLPTRSGAKRIYRKRVEVSGLTYHPVAYTHVVVQDGRRYEYRATRRARLVVEAAMNRLDYDEFIRILKEEPETAETLAFLPAEYDVHHNDKDPLNDALENLVVETHERHAQRHALTNPNFNVEHTHPVRVLAVELLGPRRTFDISMAEPFANFVVNDGVIVHNCGKTMVAKAVAKKWRRPLLRFDISRVFGSHVGQSEQQMRTALDVAEAVGGVLWVDELEKGLAGLASSGQSDAGTAARVFGTFLTWMQEKSSDVFVVATSNDISLLPPELYRKGRFDEIFFVDLPTVQERAEIFEIHLRERGRKPEAFDLSKLANEADEFSGAEIREVILDGLTHAFASGASDVTTEHILNSIGSTKPLAKTAAERIHLTREWAKDRTRRATEVIDTPVMRNRRISK